MYGYYVGTLEGTTKWAFYDASGGNPSLFSGSLTVNGTNTTMPNQTAAGSNSVMTRGLGDARWLQTATAGTVRTGTASLDFGSITNGTEATLTITVTGATTTNSPSVALGWSAALEDGIEVKQAWVSANDTVSVRVRNNNGSPIDPAAVTCRATVSSF